MSPWSCAPAGHTSSYSQAPDVLQQQGVLRTNGSAVLRACCSAVGQQAPASDVACLQLAISTAQQAVEAYKQQPSAANMTRAVLLYGALSYSLGLSGATKEELQTLYSQHGSAAYLQHKAAREEERKAAQLREGEYAGVSKRA